jgi:hypothetical protein
MQGLLKSKNVLGLIILLVLLFILVPLVLIFVVHPIKQTPTGNVNGKAQTPTLAANTELATFNGTPIYVSDLNSLALEQYRTNEAKSLNAVSINSLLNTYVERKILDKQNLGDVSSQIAQVEKTTGLTGNLAKYEAMREKFTATATKNWSVYSIDFWLPPVEDLKQASPERQQQSTDVNNALDFAKTALQQGTSVFNVAKQIEQKYPSLVSSLGVNTTQFRNSTNPSDWTKPAVYYYDKTNADQPRYKTLYAMTDTSPVTKILNEGSMGGSVIKIVKVNNPNGILDSYDNWLKSQESELIIVNDAIKNVRSAK